MSLAPCIRHLRDYVAIPSVNPMNRSDIPAEIAGERRYAEHLREQLRRLGCDAEVVGSGDRASVVAEIRASDPAAETVLVASHLDTVPIDGMEIDAFDPVVRDGRLYGRGSCDTKGGMAALVAALERVLVDGSLRRHVIVVGEADEELGSDGVRDVLTHLGGRRPDWVLATEPTELRIVTHHKGVVHARLETRGRACHASDPGAGRNALVDLARAVLALDALGKALADRVDPRLGPATLSIGIAGGGQAPNVVPDAAWLLADRRLLPDEDAAGVEQELRQALEQHGVANTEVAWCRVMKPALGTPDQHPAVRACQRALAVGAAADPVGVAFGTDAGVFAESGIPGIVMGPGSIELAHTARESVPVAEVEAMADFFIRLLTDR